MKSRFPGVFPTFGKCPQSALGLNDFPCLFGKGISLRIYLMVPHDCVSSSTCKGKFLIFLICVLFVFKSEFLFVFKSEKGVSE